MGKGRIPARIPSQSVPFLTDTVVLNGDIDFANVQDAVDAASDGDYIAIGPGTYDEDVSVSNDDLTIEGVGRKSELNGQGNGPALDVSGNGVTVQNLAARTEATGATNSAVKGSGNDFTLSNITVPNSTSHGIELSGIFRLRLELIDVVDTATDGINLTGSCQGSIDQATLQGNISRHGINVGTDVDELSISQPHIKDLSNDGINITNDRTVVNGIIANGPNNGVVVESDSARSVIEGDWIGFAGSRGIDVAGSECMIVGVAMASNTDDDIRIQSGASDCQIRGQTGDGSITDNGSGTAQNPTGAGANEIDWTEDGNSPATATGANSITYTLNSTWDMLRVEVLMNDTNNDGNNGSMVIDGNTSTGDYDGTDYNGDSVGDSDSGTILPIPSGGKTRQTLTINAEGAEAAYGTHIGTSGGTVDGGRLVSGSFDGQVNSIKFDKGSSADWRVEVYGRDVPAP